MKIVKCPECYALREIGDDVVLPICKICGNEMVELKEEDADYGYR